MSVSIAGDSLVTFSYQYGIRYQILAKAVDKPDTPYILVWRDDSQRITIASALDEV